MNRWFKPSLSIQIRIDGLSPVPVFLSAADAGVCNWQENRCFVGHYTAALLHGDSHRRPLALPRDVAPRPCRRTLGRPEEDKWVLPRQCGCGLV